MSAINVKNKPVELYDDGYLKNPESWTEDVAVVMAEAEGVKLTEEHWELLRYLRNYYEEKLVSPNVKILVKHMKETFSDRDIDTKRLYELFPKGPAFQGCKFAGLPKPTNCIDG